MEQRRAGRIEIAPTLRPSPNAIGRHTRLVSFPCVATLQRVRKWIATDLGKFAVHTTRKRLIQVQRDLKAAGKPFRAFEVLNLGRYERQAYLNVGGRLTGKKKEQALARKEQEFRELILKAYRAEPLAEADSSRARTAGDSSSSDQSTSPWGACSWRK